LLITQRILSGDLVIAGIVCQLNLILEECSDA
jgi:hypothetical protein